MDNFGAFIESNSAFCEVNRVYAAYFCSFAGRVNGKHIASINREGCVNSRYRNSLEVFRNVGFNSVNYNRNNRRISICIVSRQYVNALRSIQFQCAVNLGERTVNNQIRAVYIHSVRVKRERVAVDYYNILPVIIIEQIINRNVFVVSDSRASPDSVFISYKATIFNHDIGVGVAFRVGYAEAVCLVEHVDRLQYAFISRNFNFASYEVNRVIVAGGNGIAFRIEYDRAVEQR